MRLNEQFRILCCLAPDWVFNAREDCSRGGVLLPRLFTLAARAAVCFLLHCPYARLAARAPPFRTESRSVVSGLSSRGRAAGECPPKILKELPFRYRRFRNFRKPCPIFAEIKGLRIRIASAIARAVKKFVRTAKAEFRGLGRTASQFSPRRTLNPFKTEKTRKNRTAQPSGKENSRVIAQCNGNSQTAPDALRVPPAAGAAGGKGFLPYPLRENSAAPRVSRERTAGDQTPSSESAYAARASPRATPRFSGREFRGLQPARFQGAQTTRYCPRTCPPSVAREAKGFFRIRTA